MLPSSPNLRFIVAPEAHGEMRNVREQETGDEAALGLSGALDRADAKRERQSIQWPNPELYNKPKKLNTMNEKALAKNFIRVGP